MKMLMVISGVLCLAWSYTVQGQTRLTDYDGNTYDTIQIGEQLWMAGNLRVTHYRNGTPIPNVTGNTEWGSLTTGARCYYDNDSTLYDSLYGALYNLYAVVDVNGLCPEGWHAPTNGEWNQIQSYLGGEAVAGGKMKEAGTLHWLAPNTGATNSSGFTGLPGGFRGMENTFGYLQENGIWWSSTTYNSSSSWSRYLWYMYAGIDANPTPKTLGLSVRCIKDLHVSLEENKSSMIRIFPNPASEEIFLENCPVGTLHIFSQTGSCVLQQTLTGNHPSIDVRHLPDGMYFIRIMGDHDALSGKFIKR